MDPFRSAHNLPAQLLLAFCREATAAFCVFGPWQANGGKKSSGML